MKEKNLSYITETTRIRNTNLKWADFVNKDGWIDWEKLDNRKELNIIIITGVGTGKTFGSTNFYLKKGMNIGLISNTKGTGEENISKLKESHILNGYKDMENWELKDNNLRDNEGNIRVRSAALRNYGSVKGARDFYADVIIYDEFNQEARQAEIKGQSPTKALQTVINRWSDRNHLIKHIYYFGNKDGASPMLSAPILLDLDVWGFSEYSEIFIVEKLFIDKWIPQTLVLNPHINEADRIRILKMWYKDINKYKKEINQFLLGTAGAAYFNEEISDEWLLDYISFTCPFEPILEYYIKKNYDRIFKICVSDEGKVWISLSKDTDNNIIYVWDIKYLKDKEKLISDEAKKNLIFSISDNMILYQNVASKYGWYNS